MNARKTLLLIAFLLTLGFVGSTAHAGCGVTPCGPTYVERTVMVPQAEYVTRMVSSTEYRWETRERTITVQKQVIETAEKTREIVEYVAELRTKTVAYTVCRPVTRTVAQPYTVQVPEWKEVVTNYSVMVPHTETRTANRIECQRFPVQETRTVCRDRGCFQVQTFKVPCDPCGCATRTVCRKVWVPNVVQESVPVTVMKVRRVSIPYQYQVTVCRPEVRTRTHRVCSYRCEQRTRNVQVCEYQQVQQTREVTYTVCKPQTRTVRYKVNTCRYIPEQRVEQYKVCVPHCVQKPIQVRVCKMVPKTILVPACPAPCSCCP